MYRHGRESLHVNRPWELMAFVKTDCKSPFCIFCKQAYIWDQWHELIEPYATIMPYMVGIGNHEQDHLSGGSKDPSGAPGEGWHPSWGNFGDDSGGECGVPMYYRFHMPDNGNAVWWYVY